MDEPQDLVMMLLNSSNENQSFSKIKKSTVMVSKNRVVNNKTKRQKSVE